MLINNYLKKMKLNHLVKEIIEKGTITKQTDITDILEKEYNISVTQSNISRILKQIKAVKVTDNNGDTIYEIQQKLEGTCDWARKFVKRIDDNGFIISIVSYPGSANIVGQLLDEKNVEGIMATLCGDSTTLVMPKDVSKIKEIKEELIKILL